MKTLHIVVSNKVATYLRRDGYIVCGNSDNQVEFAFDSEWDAYTRKTARFIWGGKYKDVEFSGNVCPVPIVANTEQLEVGVYVDNLSTTTSAVIPCRRSILCHSDIKCEGTVVVPEGTPVLIEKTITENGEHYPGEDADGFYKVTVKVADKQVIPEGYIKPIGTKSITENGTHDVTEFASVEVAVESEGEVIPEISEVDDFTVFAGGADEGSLEIAYSVSQKVALPAANPALLTTLDDENFTVDNIKKGVSVFGLTGAYEGTNSPLPIEIATEAEMTALLESGEVGGVYKYTGTTGTYENGALYVLEEEEEDALAGTWVFNDVLSDSSTSWVYVNVNFTCNGVEYYQLIHMWSNDYKKVRLTYSSKTSGASAEVHSYNGWKDVNYKTITITSALSAVTDGTAFLGWLRANATKQ